MIIPDEHIRRRTHTNTHTHIRARVHAHTHTHSMNRPLLLEWHADASTWSPKASASLQTVSKVSSLICSVTADNRKTQDDMDDLKPVCADPD